MKRSFLFIFFIIVLLVGCSNDGTDAPKSKGSESIYLAGSELEVRLPLPFDINEFETTYYKELKAFMNEYEENLKSKLEASDEKAQMTFTDKKILFEAGQMVEAVVFLSVLNDTVQGDEEIEGFSTNFIIDLLDEGFYYNTSISDGLEIKVNATDKTNVSIGVFNASRKK